MKLRSGDCLAWRCLDRCDLTFHELNVDEAGGTTILVVSSEKKFLNIFRSVHMNMYKVPIRTFAMHVNILLNIKTDIYISKHKSNVNACIHVLYPLAHIQRKFS